MVKCSSPAFHNQTGVTIEKPKKFTQLCVVVVNLLNHPSCSFIPLGTASKSSDPQFGNSLLWNTSRLHPTLTSPNSECKVVHIKLQILVWLTLGPSKLQCGHGRWNLGSLKPTFLDFWLSAAAYVPADPCEAWQPACPTPPTLRRMTARLMHSWTDTSQTWRG